MHMGSIFDFMEKKNLPLSFGTLFSKTAIFSKESPKNKKQFFFFIKSKMLPICNFYNKFSILASSDPVEWVPDGPVPHGAQNWLGRAVGGRDLEFS